VRRVNAHEIPMVHLGASNSGPWLRSRKRQAAIARTSGGVGLLAIRSADTFHRINEFEYPACVLQYFVAQSYSKGLRMGNL
jgi:hypothetical protein